MMATAVLTVAFAVAGLILALAGWISSTIGRGHWWFVSALVCFGLTAWGLWDLLS